MSNGKLFASADIDKLIFTGAGKLYHDLNKISNKHKFSALVTISPKNDGIFIEFPSDYFSYKIKNKVHLSAVRMIPGTIECRRY